MSKLKNTRVLMLATIGFEESELVDPRKTLLEAGMIVHLASPNKSPIVGVQYNAVTGRHDKSNVSITPDLAFDEVDVQSYDVLLLPGGVVSPDKLRMDPLAIKIVKSFMKAEKIVAAICHAPWLLVETRMLKGRRMTGWYSIRTDLENAGAVVVDEPVVIDGNLITSRMPKDLPDFSAAILQAVESVTEKSHWQGVSSYA